MEKGGGEATNAAGPHLRELTEAGQAWGVETEYWDIWGKQHRASARVAKAILQSLGVADDAGESLERAARERSWREWLRPLAPTLVLSIGQSPYPIAVSLPAARANAAALLEIRFEHGGARQIPVALGELAVYEEMLLGGQRFVRKQISLPVDLPLGYHELSIAIDGASCPPSRLIVCPLRVFEPPWLASGRAAGIGISLYGVRSQRNWGPGDITDLKAVVDWAAEDARASFIALNPLHAIPNRPPFNTSPYLPNSVFYRNPIYLDIEQCEDFHACPQALNLLPSH